MDGPLSDRLPLGGHFLPHILDAVTLTPCLRAGLRGAPGPATRRPPARAGRQAFPHPTPRASTRAAAPGKEEGRTLPPKRPARSGPPLLNWNKGRQLVRGARRKSSSLSRPWSTITRAFIGTRS